MHLLRSTAWIITSVCATIPAYWITTHAAISRWRRGGTTSYKALVCWWAAYTLFALLISAPWRYALLYRTSVVAWCASAVLWLFALNVYRRIPRFGLGRFVGKTELTATPSQVIRTGMHARVRHPIYVGHLAMLTAWCVASGSIACYGLLLWAVITGASMIRLEESELVARFGEDYRTYQQQVPMLFPRLRS
jgi:protein-S-isoprenylcysteine O-methyltransferase Ste14